MMLNQGSKVIEPHSIH